MSMNNLNEQVNKRVIFDNDDYGIYLPYNLASICSLVPHWCASQNGKDRTLEAFKQKGVLYIVNNKKDKNWYILQDEGSSIPLQKSGKYRMYSPSADGYIYQNSQSAKKYFSQSREVIKELNLDYTVNEMLKYGMPFTPEEMKEYSETTPFAKEIYNQIQNKENSENWRLSDFDVLAEFTGADDIEIIDEPYDTWDDIANGAVAIYPERAGVTFYAEDSYFKEKFLNLTDDDDWVYSAAMGHGYDDCEEMDYEEMNYLGNYLSQENIGRYNEIRTLVGLDIMTDLHSDEGDIIDSLEEYFPTQAERLQSDWLYSLGCAIGRGRAKGIREYIDDEILFEYKDNGQNMEMFIPWSSLLRLVGKNGLENFEGVVDMEVNDIGSLYDMYYDIWDVDDEGADEMNDDFKRMIENIKEDGIEGFDKIKENVDKFQELVIKQFDFIPESNYGGIKNSYKLRNPIPHPQGPVRDDGMTVAGGEPTPIHIKEFKPTTGEISFFKTGIGYHRQADKLTMNIDEFVKHLNDIKNNPEIPFPEEEPKMKEKIGKELANSLMNNEPNDSSSEVQENHTQRIIDNIISGVIQENIQK